MITFTNSTEAPSIQAICVMTIMNDVEVLEAAGYKIIRVEANYNLKGLLFPNQTFEDYIPGFASYELGTLPPPDNSHELAEMPRYRIVVEEVTEERYIRFG